MNRKIVIPAVAGWFVLAAASLALSAEIAGTVSDVDNHPVQGIQIAVKDGTGKVLGKVPTDDRGQYHITGIADGAYEYALEAPGTSFEPGTAEAYLSDKGLTINWKVSRGNPAVALSTEGIGDTAIAGDPFGLSAGAFAGVALGGTGVVEGGVIGGYAAAGGFSGPSSPSK